MKTKTWGISDYEHWADGGKGRRTISESFDLVDRLSPGIITAAHVRGSDESKYNYLHERANGSDVDEPKSAFPGDGIHSWATPYDIRSKVRYDEGPRDRAWMAERDRNYVCRLEREGRLDVEEPNLRTEAPWLYQKIHELRQSAEKIKSVEQELAELRRQEQELGKKLEQQLAEEKEKKRKEEEVKQREAELAKRKCAEEEEKKRREEEMRQREAELDRRAKELESKKLQEQKTRKDKLSQTMTEIRQAKASNADPKAINKLYGEAEALALEFKNELFFVDWGNFYVESAKKSSSALQREMFYTKALSEYQKAMQIEPFSEAVLKIEQVQMELNKIRSSSTAQAAAQQGIYRPLPSRAELTPEQVAALDKKKAELRANPR